VKEKSLLNSLIGQELHGELKNSSSLSNPSPRYHKSHDGFLMEDGAEAKWWL